MRKNFANLLKLLESNRGAGIVTVLVTVLLISILGASLLFTSYMGYKLKVSERGGKESFYSANAAMDEIKSGVQQAVTESLSTAYTKVLSEYTALSAAGSTAIQAKFTEIFLDDLTDWQTGGGTPLFASSSTYSLDALRTFITIPGDGSTVTVSGGSCSVATETIGEETMLRLEDISVTYTAADGYESCVSSDITISMPDFYATTATIVSSELPSFALIADGTVYSQVNDPVLTGNAYVGAMSLSSNANDLSLTGGTIVCAGTADVFSGAMLKTDADSELWAQNISLGLSGSALLYGRTFVADDLSLDGNNSAAELRGSYYGFGSGSVAGTSSAIVINGKNTVLDIDALERLVLAGVGFVNTTDGSVRTGESVSAKSNQLAYLIDQDCVSVSSYFDNNSNGVFDAGDSEGSVTGINPCVFTGDRLVYSINTGLSLWGGSRTLQYYGVQYNAETGTYNCVTPVVKNLSGTGGYKMAYFFLEFSTQDKANEYFIEYFSANPEKIEEYINVYVNLSNKAGITLTSGNSFYENTSDQLCLLTSSSSVNVEGRATQFSNRCQTLNPGKSAYFEDGTPYTPYLYYVNEDTIYGTISFTLPEDATNTIVGRIISGDYTITSAETASVIIVTGNATVSSDYSGLLIVGGDVTMNADITYSPTEAEDALYGSVDSAGNLLSSYMLNTVVGGEGSAGTSTSWDLDLLVSYENWSKS